MYIFWRRDIKYSEYIQLGSYSYNPLQNVSERGERDERKKIRMVHIFRFIKNTKI